MIFSHQRYYNGGMNKKESEQREEIGVILKDLEVRPMVTNEKRWYTLPPLLWAAILIQ
jgi:hypothetical protein